MNQEIKKQSIFPIGGINYDFAQYFSDECYLKILSQEQIVIANVTFRPGCRNNWHIHQADKGGGQILLVTAGEGWYQEWDKEPVKLYPGMVVNIPPNVKHWHGATDNAWFQHIAIEVPGENCKTQWFESSKSVNL